jgi:hypothetical protein
MTLTLTPGCYGQTEKGGVVGPLRRMADEYWTDSADTGCWMGDGQPWGRRGRTATWLGPIIAIVSDAGAEADCPDCGLPHPSTNPYCFCKPRKEVVPVDETTTHPATCPGVTDGATDAPAAEWTAVRKWLAAQDEPAVAVAVAHIDRAMEISDG